MVFITFYLPILHQVLPRKKLKIWVCQDFSPSLSLLLVLLDPRTSTYHGREWAERVSNGLCKCLSIILGDIGTDTKKLLPRPRSID